MFHENIDDVVITLLGLIVTGIAILIAIIFNINAVQQNSKNQEYQMTKDFFKEFHEIDSIPKQNVTNYVIKINNFSQMVLDLHISGIVDRKMITKNLGAVFQEAYWIHKEIESGKSKEMKEFDDWCDKNKIEPISIDMARRQFIKKITFDGVSITVST